MKLFQNNLYRINELFNWYLCELSFKNDHFKETNKIVFRRKIVWSPKRKWFHFRSSKVFGELHCWRQFFSTFDHNSNALFCNPQFAFDAMIFDEHPSQLDIPVFAITIFTFYNLQLHFTIFSFLSVGELCLQFTLHSKKIS